MGQEIGFKEIRKIVEDGLKIMYEDVMDVDITFCVEADDGWRVNVLFKGQHDLFSRNALFRIDSATGEIKEFKEGRIWIL